jgi:hypothetical protein
MDLVLFLMSLRTASLEPDPFADDDIIFAISAADEILSKAGVV